MDSGLAASQRPGMTAFHARLDPVNNLLEYVDVGHGLAFVRKPDGTTISLSTDDLPLGVGTDWRVETVEFDPGAMLVVCSDGLLDIITDDSDSSALPPLIGKYDSPPALAAAVRSWVSDTISIDDVTVIAIQRAAS